MAILGKIRSRGVLLMIVVGLALFAFIIGDFLTQGSTYFNKSREVVAEIAGDKININEYSAMIDQMQEVYKIETGQSELNEETTSQLRNSVWESLVNEKLINAEAAKMGLTVGTEELSEYLIGNKIHSLISQRRAFAGENGQFSRPALVQFLNSLEQTPENQEMQAQIQKLKSYWLFWEKAVKNAVLQEKYNALMSKAVTANSLEAKMQYEAAKTSVDVNYIVQPYFMIADSTVKVSNSELKDLYKKKKELYKQEANTSIQYVVFKVKPSPEDYKKAETIMNSLSEEFKTTSDIASFTNTNSETRYTDTPLSEKNVPANLKDFAFGNGAGAVMGPIFENDTYTMARVVETGIMQSDSVKLRHIYLVAKDEAKTDSIVGAIKAGANFAELAKKYSAVQQTAANGGEIGWIFDGIQGITKEMSTKAFASGTNEVFTIKDAQGTQIMQVMEKTPARRKVRLAVLDIKVNTSNITVSKIYNEAKQFAAELKASDFEKRATEKKLEVRLASDLMATTEKIADISNSRQIIRWSFENSKGTVSDVYDCGNDFVVATITDKAEKGYRSLEKVTDALKAEIIRDKKAEIMSKDIAEKLAKNPTIDGLAMAMSLEVKLAPAVNFDAYQFGAAGPEPSVVGKVSVLPVNKVSAPIKGNAGVYVVTTANPQQNPAPFDAKMQVMMLNSRMSYSLPYMITQNIREKSNLVDNRLNFY